MKQTLTPSQKALVDNHIALAEKLAMKACQRYSMNRAAGDDVFSSAYEGLVDAALRFDPKQNSTFSTFAYYRIRGSILDGLREETKISGWKRRTLLTDTRANDYLQNQSASRRSEPRGTTEKRVETLANHIADVATITRVAMNEETLQDSRKERGEDTVSLLEKKQEYETLSLALKTLPDRERKILEMSYFQEKSFADVGAELGLSRSWTSRLHINAIKKMRTALQEMAAYNDTS